MISIPSIERFTTFAPFAAIFTERSATTADSSAFEDTWSIDIAISLIAADAPAISCAWCSDASANWLVIPCVLAVYCATS